MPPASTAIAAAKPFPVAGMPAEGRTRVFRRAAGPLMRERRRGRVPRWARTRVFKEEVPVQADHRRQEEEAVHVHEVVLIVAAAGRGAQWRKRLASVGEGAVSRSSAGGGGGVEARRLTW